MTAVEQLLELTRIELLWQANELFSLKSRDNKPDLIVQLTLYNKCLVRGSGGWATRDIDVGPSDYVNSCIFYSPPLTFQDSLITSLLRSLGLLPWSLSCPPRSPPMHFLDQCGRRTTYSRTKIPSLMFRLPPNTKSRCQWLVQHAVIALGPAS